MIRSRLGSTLRSFGAGLSRLPGVCLPWMCLALGVGAGCGGEPPLRSTVAVYDDRPAERLRQSSLDVPMVEIEPDPGEEWRFDEQGQTITVDLPPLEATPEAIVLHFEPAATRTIEVTWSVDDTTAETSRYAKSIRMRRRAEPTDRTVMLTKSSWSNAVDQLTVSITSWPGEATVLRRIELTAPVRTAEQLGPRAEQVWRVSAGGEVRRAVTASVDRPLRWSIDRVPDDATLHAGFTLLHSNRNPIDFTVSAGERQLALHRMEPFDPKTDERWRDFDYDLGDFAGQPLELRFAMAHTEAPVEGESFWSLPRLSAPLADPPPVRGIVVLSLDHLKPERMSLFGGSRPTTPWLDRWVQAEDVAILGVTGAAQHAREMALEWLAGRGADGEKGARSNVERDELIASLLRTEGYRTFALVDGGLFEPWMGYDIGFDRYRQWPELDSDLARTVDHAIAWIDELAEEPFFLLLHSNELGRLDEPAQPFFRRMSGLRAPPIEWLSRSADGDLLLGGQPLPERLADLPDDLYDARLARADFSIHRLLEALEARGLRDETLVVVTGGITGQSLEPKKPVPLLVRFPGHVTGFRRASLDELPIADRRDLLPTLLDAVQMESPPDDLEGHSLLDGWESGHLSNLGASDPGSSSPSPSSRPPAQPNGDAR